MVNTSQGQPNIRKEEPNEMKKSQAEDSSFFILHPTFSDISRYRGELMGAAMLFIILFHVWLPRGDMFFGLRRCGNVGVDMFLFLSGMGLWYAWSKHPTLKQYFIRRYVRIYPAWLIIACLYYIPRFPKGGQLSDLLGDILINWDFWLNCELHFWYIPAIMMLYTVAPLYMALIERQPLYRWLPVVAVTWCVMVEWVTPIHEAVGHLEIFWSRIPIFLIGINMGEQIRQQRTVEPQAAWLLLLVFLMTFGTCVYLEQVKHGHFPIFIERMLYIPLTVTGIFLLCHLLNHAPRWLNASLRFVGTISLEVYLIHVHFVLAYIQPYRLGYWPTVILVTIATLPLAWLLHRVLSPLQSSIIDKTKKI